MARDSFIEIIGLSDVETAKRRAAAIAREREIKSWKSARLIQIRLLGLKT